MNWCPSEITLWFIFCPLPVALRILQATWSKSSNNRREYPCDVSPWISFWGTWIMLLIISSAQFPLPVLTWLMCGSSLGRLCRGLLEQAALRWDGLPKNQGRSVCAIEGRVMKCSFGPERAACPRFPCVQVYFLALLTGMGPQPE